MHIYYIRNPRLYFKKYWCVFFANFIRLCARYFECSVVIALKWKVIGYSCLFLFFCSSQLATAKEQASVLKHLADGVFVLKTRYAEGVAFDIENTSKVPVRVDLTLTEAESRWTCACTRVLHANCMRVIHLRACVCVRVCVCVCVCLDLYLCGRGGVMCLK